MADDAVKVTLGTGGPLDVTRFNANTFNVMSSPTEVTILFLSQVAGVNADGELELGSIPVAQLGLSPASAKELLAVLGNVVDKIEAECGEITTPFLKERAQK